jgi:hypothetical protein
MEKKMTCISGKLPAGIFCARLFLPVSAGNVKGAGRMDHIEQVKQMQRRVKIILNSEVAKFKG